MSSLYRLRSAVKQIEKHVISYIYGRPFPPENFTFAAAVSRPQITASAAKITIKEIIGDGFLWAVPKFRRTVEKRWKRKFGSPEYVWKMLVPKKNLVNCKSCGHHHEIGVLCPTCYKKICEETKEIEEKIQAELGLNPIENDVVVLYEGEKAEQPDEFWNGKRIIEMQKQRPSWFSKNLLQQTTKQPSTSTDVKPTDLA